MDEGERKLRIMMRREEGRICYCKVNNDDKILRISIR